MSVQHSAREMAQRELERKLSMRIKVPPPPAALPRRLFSPLMFPDVGSPLLPSRARGIEPTWSRNSILFILLRVPRTPLEIFLSDLLARFPFPVSCSFGAPCRLQCRLVLWPPLVIDLRGSSVFLLRVFVSGHGGIPQCSDGGRAGGKGGFACRVWVWGWSTPD